MKDNQIILYIIIGIVALFLISFLVGFIFSFGYTNYNMMGNYGYGMMSGFGGFFSWVFMLLVVIALVLFIVWLVKQINGNGKGNRRKK